VESSDRFTQDRISTYRCSVGITYPRPTTPHG